MATHNKINNPNYIKFLDEGIINVLTEEHINKALQNIKGKHIKTHRAFLIALYYTGGRPGEVLDLRGRDFSRDKSYILIKMAASKGGLPRTVRLRFSLPLVKELYFYAIGMFPDMYLFFYLRSNYIKKYIGKRGNEHVRIEKSAKLRYYFKRWFYNVIEGGINPYYLRHNRFSKLSEAGATMEDIRQIKGCKTFDSITPYIHMSKAKSVSLAKKIS